MLVAGILLELGNAAYSWNNGLRARGHDPWGGATLEWFALSPPPPHNFDAVPDVRSTEPLRDIRESIERRDGGLRGPATARAHRRCDPRRGAGAGRRGTGLRRGWRRKHLGSLSPMTSESPPVAMATSWPAFAASSP